MVDEILPATSDCIHVGWALWRDHWQWYCAGCGIDVSEPNLINEIGLHQPGELWKGNEISEEA